MRLEFHKQVAFDILRILEYYEAAGGPDLAAEFYSELKQCFKKAADSPTSYRVREGDLPRVNLGRFPYHFLFRIVEDSVRVLVVRHHKRQPSLGRRRS